MLEARSLGWRLVSRRRQRRALSSCLYTLFVARTLRILNIRVRDSSPYLPTQFHLPSSVPLKIFGDMSDTDQINLKVQLRNRLNSGQLSNMPGGFPFHHIFDGHGSAYMSSDSFEFREEFLISSHNQRPRYQTATISFTSAVRKGNYLTWRAFLPSRDPSRCRGSTGKFAVAHVQVESAVMNTLYGKAIRKSPSVILRALAISLELGVQITMQLANSSIPLPRSSRNYPLRQDTVVYIGTYNDGREDILFVVNQ